MNLIELQNKIHQQNKEMGWWDDPRDWKTLANLFRSELAEAMEGDRKGLLDDHLPKYPMYWVELADFVIRLLDYLATVEHLKYEYCTGFCTDECNSENDFLNDMYDQVSGFSLHMQDPYYKHTQAPYDKLAFCVCASFEWAEIEGVNLHQIILEKVEYNKHRADHKRENRAKEGGKKY